MRRKQGGDLLAVITCTTA